MQENGRKDFHMSKAVRRITRRNKISVACGEKSLSSTGMGKSQAIFGRVDAEKTLSVNETI